MKSDDNIVKGLQITQCQGGIIVFNTGGPTANNNVIGGTTEDERNVLFLNGTAVVFNGNTSADQRRLNVT